MIQLPDHNRHDSYVVRVGHLRVTVQCATVSDAVRLARKKLAAEMPRLYDVIHGIDERAFLVDRDQ